MASLTRSVATNETLHSHCLLMITKAHIRISVPLVTCEQLYLVSSVPDKGVRLPPILYGSSINVLSFISWYDSRRTIFIQDG